MTKEEIQSQREEILAEILSIPYSNFAVVVI